MMAAITMATTSLHYQLIMLPIKHVLLLQAGWPFTGTELNYKKSSQKTTMFAHSLKQSEEESEKISLTLLELVLQMVSVWA